MSCTKKTGKPNIYGQTNTWCLPRPHVWRTQPETSADQMLSRSYWFLELDATAILDHGISAHVSEHLKMSYETEHIST